MRYVFILAAVLIGLAALIFVGQIVASETGEVVVLETRSPDGAQETRLWVVEMDGIQYLRSGPDSGWYLRLLAEPEVRLTRDGHTASYRAEPGTEAAAAVNERMRAKYGWRDAYIELLLGGREDAIAVALVPEA